MCFTHLGQAEQMAPLLFPLLFPATKVTACQGPSGPNNPPPSSYDHCRSVLNESWATSPATARTSAVAAASEDARITAPFYGRSHGSSIGSECRVVQFIDFRACWGYSYFHAEAAPWSVNYLL